MLVAVLWNELGTGALFGKNEHIHVGIAEESYVSILNHEKFKNNLVNTSQVFCLSCQTFLRAAVFVSCVSSMMPPPLSEPLAGTRPACNAMSTSFADLAGVFLPAVPQMQGTAQEVRDFQVGSCALFNRIQTFHIV